MKNKKIMFVFGTRPEAIKLAPVVEEVRRRGGSLSSVVVTTGQHREMLDQVLEAFGIKPDHDLEIMEENQSIEGAVVKCLQKLPRVISRERPDIVMVQGDTSTTFAASLCAYYQKVAVGHVEAGLRTRDKYSPFPEEINRKLTSAIAELHFAPTDAARDVLISENVPADRIFLTGNTVIDALFRTLEKRLDLRRAGVVPSGRKIVLVTAHRRESFGRPLQEMLMALREIAQRHCDDVDIVFPVHRNPMVREPVRKVLGRARNVRLLDPLDYPTFVHLMKASYIILTDSGGIQEEAPSLGKPVLVLRDVTERPEGVRAGCVRVVGTRRGGIVTAALKLIENKGEYERMSKARNPYGDGKASGRIVKVLLDRFGLRKARPDEIEFSAEREIE